MFEWRSINRLVKWDQAISFHCSKCRTHLPNSKCGETSCLIKKARHGSFTDRKTTKYFNLFRGMGSSSLTVSDTKTHNTDIQGSYHGVMVISAGQQEQRRSRVDRHLSSNTTSSSSSSSVVGDNRRRWYFQMTVGMSIWVLWWGCRSGRRARWDDDDE
jgi:hypothetical protein